MPINFHHRTVNQLGNLRLERKIHIGTKGNASILSPFPYHDGINIYQRRNILFFISKYYRFFYVRAEFQAVFKKHRAKHLTAIIMHYIRNPVDYYQMAVGIDIPGISRMEPATFKQLGSLFRQLVIARSNRGG